MRGVALWSLLGMSYVEPERRAPLMNKLLLAAVGLTLSGCVVVTVHDDDDKKPDNPSCSDIQTVMELGSGSLTKNQATGESKFDCPNTLGVAPALPGRQ